VNKKYSSPKTPCGPSRYQHLFPGVAAVTVRELGAAVMGLPWETEAPGKSQNFKQAFPYAQQLEMKQ